MVRRQSDKATVQCNPPLPLPLSPCAGGDRALLSYQSHRLRHNLPILGATDALHRLYTTKWPPAVVARSLGLQLVEAVKPLKVCACLKCSVVASTAYPTSPPCPTTGLAHGGCREAELTDHH